MNTESQSRFMRMFHEISPLKVGDRVTVSPNYIHAGEWQDTYLVVGIRWDYQRGRGNDLDISIATEDEICSRYGCTDGFGPRDLVFVERPQS